MRAQNSDRLTLEETVQVMRDFGTPPEYIEGYAAGFKGQPQGRKNIAYLRGFDQGRSAWLRGAHKV